MRGLRGRAPPGVRPLLLLPVLRRGCVLGLLLLLAVFCLLYATLINQLILLRLDLTAGDLDLPSLQDAPPQPPGAARGGPEVGAGPVTRRLQPSSSGTSTAPPVSTELEAVSVLRNSSLGPPGPLHRRIPNIIHQTWDDSKVPGQVAKWVVSWNKHNPDFEYRFWTDAGARTLIEEDFIDKYTHLYDDYPYKINRADVRRLFILYRQGGVFADLDVECVRGLHDVVAKYECLLAQEPEEHQALFYDYKHHNYALTGFMACRPHHPFFKLLLQLLPHYARNARSGHWNDNILNSTGPMFVSDVVRQYVERYNTSEYGLLHLAPSHWFMPTYDPVHYDEFYMKCSKTQVPPLSAKQQAVCDRLRRRKFLNIAHEDAYTNHHWLHSWAHMFIPQGFWDIQEIVKKVVMVDR